MDLDIRLQPEIWTHRKWLRLESCSYVHWPRELIDSEGEPIADDPCKHFDALLRVSKSLAIERTRLGLIALWSWVGVHAPDGIIKDVTARELASMAGIGSPTSYTFLDVLIECGWIDVLEQSAVEDGQDDEDVRYTLKIHEWEQHQPFVVGREERRARGRKAHAASEKSKKKAAAAKKKKAKKARNGDPKQSTPSGTPTPDSSPDPRSTSEGGRGATAPQPPPELHPPGSAAAPSQTPEGDWTPEELHAVLAHVSDALAFDLPADDSPEYPRWFDALNHALGTLATESLAPDPRMVRQLAATTMQRFQGQVSDPQGLWSVITEAVRAAQNQAPPGPDPLRDSPDAWGRGSP